MKIFVWEGDGVLTDYTNGMIVAIAADLESALLAIEAKCDYCMQSFPNHKPTQVVELATVEVTPSRMLGYVTVAVNCYIDR
jgi:hypothetical protein